MIGGSMISLLARPDREDGLIGTWSPGIGDPTPVGWFTAFAYLGAAWVCYRVASRTPTFLAEARRERNVWLVLAVVMAALGVNKQLDLQSAVTELGRLLLRGRGLYDERRSLQEVFIVGVAIVAIVAIGWLLFLARRTSRQTRTAILGAMLVFAFVVIRAASFHHIDRLLGVEWLGLRINWIAELSGIFIVVGAGLSRFARLRRLK
jgi:hypothetical protein